MNARESITFQFVTNWQNFEKSKFRIITRKKFDYLIFGYYFQKIQEESFVKNRHFGKIFKILGKILCVYLERCIETAGYVKHCHLFVAAKNPQE